MAELDGTDLFMAALEAAAEREAAKLPEPTSVEGVPLDALLDTGCPDDVQRPDVQGWGREFRDFPPELIRLLRILEPRTSKDQAIPGADLAVMLGMCEPSASRATRASQVRGLLATWMDRGLPFPIVGSDRGYYHATTPEDVRAYAARLVSQASETLARLRGFVMQCEATPLHRDVPPLKAVDQAVAHARTLSQRINRG